jgi:hypothetical protein
MLDNFDIFYGLKDFCNSLLRRNFYFPVMKLQGPQNPNALALSGGGRQVACGGESFESLKALLLDRTA